MKKSLLKGTLLLSSMFLLAACGSTEETTESVESEVSSVVEEEVEEEVVESEESVEEESVEEESAEESEEASDSEESSEESTVEESEEASSEESDSEEESEESVEEASSEESDSEEASEESVEEASSEESDSEEESEESAEEASSEESDSEEESEESAEEASSEESDSEDSAVIGESAETVTLVDGEYAVVGNPDERGWAITHTLTVEDGVITDSNFDYINAEGGLKSEDEEYNTQMESVTGVSSADATQELNDALVETQSADVDAVTGATSTSASFTFTSEVLLELAAQGITEEVNVDELELADGEYNAESDNGEVVTITVEAGEVTEATFEAEDQEAADAIVAAYLEAGSLEGLEAEEGQEELFATFSALVKEATNDAKLASLKVDADETEGEESSEESDPSESEEESEEASEESEGSSDASSEESEESAE